MRDRCQSQVRRPGLDEDHVAGNQAGRIGTASCIRLRVEYHCTVTVLRLPEDLVELDRKTIQVTNV